MLTVGLLTYNHGKYILDALKGLLAQESDEVELIILDDASTDDTKQILQEYSVQMKKKYKSFFTIFHESNVGIVSKNCNEIIDCASGDYIWLIAGDDILLEGAFTQMLAILQKESQCSVVYANMYEIADNYHYGEDYDTQTMFLKNQSAGLQKRMFQRLIIANCIAAPAVVKRKELYAKYGKHDETFLAEDYEYWLRISRTEKFYFLDVPVVLYRRAETSITNYASSYGWGKLQRMMETDFKIKKKYAKYLNDVEKSVMWNEYYLGYSAECRKIGYDEGGVWLTNTMKDNHILIDERYTDIEAFAERHIKELDLIEILEEVSKSPFFWNDLLDRRGIHSVAVYGYTHLAKVLIEQLLRAGVDVKYVIDRKGNALQIDRQVYTLQETLVQVDAVIVVPLGLKDKVEEEIRAKLNTVIMDVESILLTNKKGSELYGTSYLNCSSNI